MKSEEELKNEHLAELARVQPETLRADIKKLLTWLGTEAANDPSFCVKQSDVYKKCFGMGAAPTDPVSDLKAARNLVRDARNHLIKFYRKVPNPGDVWISIPNGHKQENPFALGAYTLQYRHGERPTVYVPPANERHLGPSELFWKRMIKPVNPQKGLLIYSDEQPELGENADVSGLYSGSGEVAAAFLIGSRTAHLKSVIDTWRSSKVSYDLLRQDPSWVVFLGSSLSNKAVRSLRLDSPWVDLQEFHFEPERDIEGTLRGVIQRGKLGREPAGEYRYSFKNSRVHEDFALISYFHDDNHSQILVALQGLSTLGTWAAARYICSDRTVQELLKRYPALKADPMPSFELLLRVEVRDYRPDNPEIVECLTHF